MGDWYEFEMRTINGIDVSGFSYQNKENDWEEVFIEMTPSQIELAMLLIEKEQKINDQKIELIKSWIKAGKK